MGGNKVNGVNVEVIIDRIHNGYYKQNEDNLIIALQLLIDIDDDSVTTYQIEKRLLEEVGFVTDNDIISFNELISRIKTIDREFLIELKNHLPKSSQNSYIQFIIDLVNEEIKKELIEVPEVINLDMEISLSELFMSLYNERRFSDNIGKKDIFFEAITIDDYHIFQAFVNNNEVNLEVRNYYNDTLVHLVASYNSVKVLAYLIQLGLDINAQNDFNYTPAFSAFLNDRFEAFQLLVDNGADLRLKNNSNLTVTEIAIMQNKLDFVKCILSNRGTKHDGINYDPYVLALDFQAISVFDYLKSVNYPMKVKLEELLFAACKNGQIEIISTILRQGLSINVCHKKRTPLLTAVINEQMEVTRYLLDQGADPNPKGHPPLLYAIKKGNIEMVKVLIEKGANPFDQGKKQLTPLMTAVYFGHIDIVKYFVGLGEDVNRIGIKKLIPLAVAAEVGQYEIASYLLEQGATILPNVKSPLTMAIQFGHTRIIELLFSQGFCLNKTVLRPSELSLMILKAKRYGMTSYLTQALTSTLKDKNNVRVCDHTMNSIKRDQKKQAFCGYILGILAIIFFCFAAWMFKDFNYFSKGTKRIEAHITQLDNTKNQVYYVFYVNGEAIQSYSTVHSDVFSDLKLGGPVEIIYKINQVEDTMLAEQHYLMLIELLIYMVGTIVMLFFALLALHMIRTDRKYINKMIKESNIKD